jgi:hypothetical protein
MTNIKYYIIFIIIFTISLFGASYYFFSMDRGDDKEEGKKPVLIIGEEKLYEEDLEYYYNRLIFSSIDYPLDQDWKFYFDNYPDILKIIIEDSATLQYGINNSLIDEINYSIDMSPKDMYLRQEYIFKAIAYIDYWDKIDVQLEVSSVWFYNQMPSELTKEKGIEYSKAQAYNLIKRVHENLENTNGNLEEASKFLREEDTYAKQLDPNYIKHSYYTLELPKNRQSIFEYGDWLSQRKYWDFIEKSSINDISDIQEEVDKTIIDSVVPAFFAIYKISKKNDKLLADELTIFSKDIKYEIYL